MLHGCAQPFQVPKVLVEQIVRCGDDVSPVRQQDVNILYECCGTDRTVEKLLKLWERYLKTAHVFRPRGTSLVDELTGTCSHAAGEVDVSRC